MDVYHLIRFVHIASAVALLACSVIASPGVRAATRRATTTQDMRAYLAIGRPLHALEPASAFVVLATGLYLTGVAGFWQVAWVQVAIAFWIANSVAAATLVKPAMTRVAQALNSAPDGPVGQQLDGLRWSARWSLGGDILLSTDAAMLYVMVMQPGLAGSLVAVVALNLVIALLRVARSRRGTLDHRRPATA